MSKILKNDKLSKDFYLMEVESKDTPLMGQFYMLRSWGDFPVLSRPISVFDADGRTIKFLYKVVGKGTEIFSNLKVGDDITLDGPHGTGYPEVKGKVALVGGGVGIAPLYHTAKVLKEKDKSTTIDLFLGFSDVALLVDEYKKVADNVITDVGGFITDHIDTKKYDYIFTCGPEIMMRVLYKKCKEEGTKAPLYVSMENRMGCGIGACLVCTCKTKSGNKRACMEGPVMLASEVFDYE